MKILYCTIIIIQLFAFYGCDSNNECISYECRRQNIKITLNPELIQLGESSQLIIKRNNFNLPHFCVYIGEYDDDFKLPQGVEEQFFEDTDSLASIYLSPETSGKKVIRGIVEEYVMVTKDSADTYRYPFEVVLIVK